MIGNHQTYSHLETLFLQESFLEDSDVLKLLGFKFLGGTFSLVAWNRLKSAISTGKVQSSLPNQFVRILFVLVAERALERTKAS